jgi:hypothetical protein
MVMDVSLLALAGLNVTREFTVSARVDVNCPAGVVCVNITVSRPYMWTARFEVLDRTVYFKEGRLYINYSLAGIDVDLVSYTEYSAVYSIKPAGLPEGRLVEYVIKVYVANIPIYLAPAVAVNPQAACQGSELRNNGWDVPIVLANFTRVDILADPTLYRNVTKINYNIYNQEVTYWVIHRNGKIVFNNNVCSGDVKQSLRDRRLYWVYP